jgi:hypothetical protein
VGEALTVEVAVETAPGVTVTWSVSVAGLALIVALIVVAVPAVTPVKVAV